jgi:hypothetical protein
MIDPAAFRAAVVDAIRSPEARSALVGAMREALATPAPDPNARLTVKEAAVEANLSEQALYKHLERGSVKARRVGRRIFILRRDLP